MRSGDRFACLPHTSTVQQAILAITHARSGIVALIEPSTRKLVGAFTDGDLRRCILAKPNCLQDAVSLYMSPKPKVSAYRKLAAEAVKQLEEVAVNDLIVVDEQHRPIGTIDTQDLPKLRLF